MLIPKLILTAADDHSGAIFIACKTCEILALPLLQAEPVATEKPFASNKETKVAQSKFSANEKYVVFANLLVASSPKMIAPNSFKPFSKHCCNAL